MTDPEWYEAESANESEVYWWVIYDKRRPERRIVKRYKPSLAKLVCKRTGWVMERVFKEGEG